MTAPPHDFHGDEIAVIGIACRLPGARDVRQYWRNLRDGVESITFYSDDELARAGVTPDLLANPEYVKSGGGRIDGIELFDAAFFGLVPKEAELLDPQQRLFLEAAVGALEDAGYDPASYPGLIGVFAGAGRANYLLQNLYGNPQLLAAVGPVAATLASDKDFLPTRVSYLLDLKGPSINVQTACSTSLVATHLACQSLLNGECDLALAGGSSITTLDETGYLYQDGGVYSNDGHCRAFDASATGMVGGNGLALVVLKRLEAALEDGDCVRAVIRGSAINNDGSAKVGFTAPGVEGQADVIAQALAAADVEPRTIGMIEAHGTGTALGDPIEVAALTRAFRASTEDRAFCALGSVKTNIGHTNAAAGAAALIKTVLSLEQREIPPSLHFDAPNPEIDFAGSPFFVNTELRDWQPAGAGAPRRAGVSSFGMGGTNAHVVLEEAPTTQPGGPARARQLLVMSAKTATALDRVTQNLADRLRAEPGLDLADVAFTLQVGRSRHPHRRIALVEDGAGAAASLTARDPERTATGTEEATDRAVAFMFPGQGAQHVGMGRELYASEAVFRTAVDAMCELLRQDLGLDLRELLYPPDADAEQAAERLQQTHFTQPALFVIEYALAKLWMSWGVQPAALIGHSIGEFVAACLAGVMSQEDALMLVAARGRLMQELEKGDMLSVSLPETELRPLLGDGLSLAAINGPSLCVAAGRPTAIAELQAKLAEREVACRVLRTSHAFHSAMMDPIVEPFAALVRGIRLSPAQLPCVSTVTGTWIQPEAWADPAYWARNLREPVRFADGAAELLTSQRVLLEVGPGQTLSALVRQQGVAATGRAVPSMPHAAEDKSDLGAALWAVGRLWMAGAVIDWNAFHGERRRRLPLPTYPFEGQRYWVDPAPAAPAVPAALAKNPDVGAWFYTPSWQRSLAPRSTAPEPGGTRLLFADEVGLAARLAKRLRDQHRVVSVSAGDGFEKTGDDAYRIDPASRADYDTLLDALRASGAWPTHLVHLWNVLPADAPATDLTTISTTQDRAFFSLLYTLQALGERLGDECAHVQIVTNDLFEVTGHEAVHPERATVLGPCRVGPIELENVSCAHVDVHLPEGEDWSELVDQLVAECAAPADDSVVAYRGPHRWTPAYRAEPLPAAPADAPWRRPGGVFVITGGLGGMGLVLAAQLAEIDGCKLALISRSGLPDSADPSDDNRTTRRRTAVEALRERGAEVMIAKADVADPDAMRDVVRAVTERFGTVRGVIHAAGASTGGLIALRTRDGAAEVLDPKVRGTLVLREVLADQPLELFALCSSLASLQGGAGAADYCGANSFLDALVTSRDLGAGTPFVALSWDAWAEVGMAAESDAPEALRAERQRYLALGIRSIEGAEAFSRAASSGLRHVYVSTRDLTARLAEDAAVRDATAVDHTSAGGEPSASVEAPTTAVPGYARPDLPQPYVAPKSDTEKTIAAAWSDVLGVGEPGVLDNFFELGGHSLLLQQLHGMLRKQFETPLSVPDLFAHPTISSLAAHLDGGASAPVFTETRDRASKQRAAMNRLGKAARKGSGSS